LFLGIASLAIQLVIVLVLLKGWHRREFAASGAAVAVFCVLGTYWSLASKAAQSDLHRLQAANNMKEIGLAMLERESAFGAFPPAALTSTDGRPLLSWRVAILPYLGEDALYKQFDLKEPWDGPHNKPLLAKMPRVYQPVTHPAKEPYLTCYQVFVQADEKGTPEAPGRAPFFQRPAHQSFGPTTSDFKDGLPNTILIVEGAEPVPWTKPEDLPYSRTAPLPKLGGEFKGGTHAVFADGTVRWIPADISEETLRALITCDGGEEVHVDELQVR
jgi:hypothetical protein